MTADTKVVDADTGDYLSIAQWTSGRRTASLGPNGWQKARVSALAAHGLKPVWRLRTESGLHLTATATHPLLTPKGWRALADLAVGDLLAAASEVPFFGTQRLVAPERRGQWFREGVIAGHVVAVPQDVFRAPRADVWRFVQAALGGSASEGLLGPQSAMDDLRHLAMRLGLLCAMTHDQIGARLRLREGEGRRAVACIGNGTEGVFRAAAPLGFERIAAITPLGDAPVYDIEVPGLHNFLANGLVIHNSTYARCGIIVNVTPFEPEWEGHVTLEFSNTSPLPARIYANEGVAQVIFFEADEPCETSYKDRGGKYQGQKGVTLPKT
ncbi:MAG: dCTP deaminase [Acidiferrobacter sp.]